MEELHHSIGSTSEEKISMERRPIHASHRSNVLLMAKGFFFSFQGGKDFIQSGKRFEGILCIKRKERRRKEKLEKDKKNINKK
jgi:hypothetical protein